MEKESKVTAAEPTSEPKRRIESAKQHAGSPRHVNFANQHKPRSTQSGRSPSNIKGAMAGRGGDQSWRDRPQSKASTRSSDPRVQNSTNAPRRGFRDSRPFPPSARSPKPTQAGLPRFEVKIADFPELAAVPLSSAGTPLARKDPWGPNLPAERCQLPPKSASPMMTIRKESPTQHDDHIPVSSSSPAGQPGVTSWANVASQPPKKIFEEKAVSSSLVPDEEEFPGLRPGRTWTDKVASIKNTEDQQNETSPFAKTQATEAAKKGQRAEKTSGKKSKAPVQLDIGSMLSVLQNKQKSAKAKLNVISVGGGLSVTHKQAAPSKKAPWEQDKIAHNPLDSTSPLVKKGKQREVPKAKKPTALKKVILKEREERKQRRLLEESGLLPENESTVMQDLAEEEQGDTSLKEVDLASVLEGNDELQVSPNETESEEAAETNQVEAYEEQSVQSAPLPTPDRPKIHSRKFREYCSQMLSKDVDQCVTSLLKELVRFQDRLYQKDPMKARMKRRLVMGLREVQKHLKLRKVKCVIISPNCERVQAKGGLDEALHNIIDTCRDQEVPFIFALSRKALGRCVNKMVPVSLVGVFNYDGAQDYYHKMIELSSEARRAYEAMLLSVEQHGHGDQDSDLEDQSATKLSEAEQSEPESEEPGYRQLWRKLLENDCNFESLNFHTWARFAECTEHTDEDEKS
ncbi:selenocysteine insertion sequence-binding protein 2-like isoform X2 [Nerophis ophidion]|uniref:selenocysteine insertion sequence-binding protein 2-like isoform X2 n=1 Tax=Nerophis ophidion TaxID=159077 RepID=UPI002AE045BE|nr:selenocysteine insertion sequence-binding protein 2-like isoform X2 [Nerophis ophidion]